MSEEDLTCLRVTEEWIEAMRAYIDSMKMKYGARDGVRVDFENGYAIVRDYSGGE